MAGSWIRFTRPDGAAVLLCEESGTLLEPLPPKESGAQVACCHLYGGGNLSALLVVGDIDSFALALGARSVP
jgi:hypothetical protein